MQGALQQPEWSRRRFLTQGAVAAFGAAGLALGLVRPARGHGVLGDVVERVGLTTEGVHGNTTISAPLRPSSPVAAVSLVGPEHVEVHVRSSDGGRRWGPWHHVPTLTDEGPDAGSEPGTDTPRALHWVGDARELQVAVEGAGLDSVDVTTVSVHGLVDWILGGRTENTPAGTRPAIVRRPQWGADESLRRGSPGYASGADVAFVHHTVTGNNYSASQAPGIVQSIYRHHVLGNGWNDIGYNFLIDRYGRIYEGRYGGVDKPVVGAHAAGFNVGSVGVALLGNFQATSLPAAARDALVDLLAWLCGLYGMNPESTTVRTSSGSTRYPRGHRARLHSISGHRDVSYTACPGEMPYGQLADVRRRVAAR